MELRDISIDNHKYGGYDFLADQKKKIMSYQANNNEQPDKGQILVYKGKDGNMKLEVRLQDESIWPSINQMAELFSVNKSSISKHLKNIYESDELERGQLLQ